MKKLNDAPVVEQGGVAPLWVGAKRGSCLVDLCPRTLANLGRSGKIESRLIFPQGGKRGRRLYNVKSIQKFIEGGAA